MFGSGLLTNLQALNSGTMPPREAVGMDITALGSMFLKRGTFTRHWTSPLGPRSVNSSGTAGRRGPHRRFQTRAQALKLSTPRNLLLGVLLTEYSQEKVPGSTACKRTFTHTSCVQAMLGIGPMVGVPFPTPNG